MRKRLTAEQIDGMVRMARAGMYADEIAEIYGCSGRRVRHWLHVRGIRRRSRKSASAQALFEKRRGQVWQLRGQGLGFGQMAQRLDVAYFTLRDWVRFHMPELHAQMVAESWARRRRPTPSSAPPIPPRPGKPSGVVVTPPPLDTARPFAHEVARLYRLGFSIGVLAQHTGQPSGKIHRLLLAQGVRMRSQASCSPRWKLARRRRDKAAR